ALDGLEAPRFARFDAGAVGRRVRALAGSSGRPGARSSQPRLHDVARGRRRQRRHGGGGGGGGWVSGRRGGPSFWGYSHDDLAPAWARSGRAIVPASGAARAADVGAWEGRRGDCVISATVKAVCLRGHRSAVRERSERPSYLAGFISAPARPAPPG